MAAPWMLILVAAASNLPAAPAEAQLACETIVWTGSVSNTSWATSGSPYCVTTDLAISALTIEAGVEVRVDGPFTLSVLTTLVVNGSEAAPVLFSAKEPAAPQDQRWKGLEFDNASSGSLLSHAIIEYSDNSGLRVVNTSPRLEHIVIRNNTSPSNGGGIQASLASGDLDISDCDIVDNSAAGSGGGVWAQTIGGSLNIDRCKVSRNRAGPPAAGIGEGLGGGLALYGQARFSNSLVSDNEAFSRGASAPISKGGGIYVNGVLYLDNTALHGNTASAEDSGPAGLSHAFGGGLYIAAGGAIAKNTTIGCNSTLGVDVNGSGAYVESGFAGLLNATVARNDGVGLNNDSGVLHLINSIVAENGVPSIAGTATVSYSLVDGSGVYAGPSNLNAVPQFAGQGCGLGELDVISGSPAIDAGDPAVMFNDVCIGPSLGTSRADIGSNGGVGACNWDRDLVSFPPDQRGVGDGIPDNLDNCQFSHNSDQRDLDKDGYGNVCDADFNQDGIVSILDLAIMRICIHSAGVVCDLDGDAWVGVLDLGVMRELFNSSPGPSHLPCAGQAPCPSS